MGAELDRYDAEDAANSGEWMRTHGSLDATLGALEGSVLRMVRQHTVIEIPAGQRADEMSRYMQDWIRRGNPSAAQLTIASLHQHVAGLQQSFNDHQHMYQSRIEAVQAEAQRQAEHAAQSNAHCNERLAEAERQAQQARTELALLQAQLREVYASRSWRVTGPLRRISTLVRPGGSQA